MAKKPREYAERLLAVCQRIFGFFASSFSSFLPNFPSPNLNSRSTAFQLFPRSAER
jgi:hypothetical protein